MVNYQKQSTIKTIDPFMHAYICNGVNNNRHCEEIKDKSIGSINSLCFLGLIVITFVVMLLESIIILLHIVEYFTKHVIGASFKILTCLSYFNFNSGSGGLL